MTFRWSLEVEVGWVLHPGHRDPHVSHQVAQTTVEDLASSSPSVDLAERMEEVESIRPPVEVVGVGSVVVVEASHRVEEEEVNRRNPSEVAMHPVGYRSLSVMEHTASEPEVRTIQVPVHSPGGTIGSLQPVRSARLPLWKRERTHRRHLLRTS